MNSLRCVAAVAAAACFLPTTPSWPADVRHYPSPDGQLHARIAFSKNSPTATPESRVTITVGAKVVFERSYESEDPTSPRLSPTRRGVLKRSRSPSRGREGPRRHEPVPVVGDRTRIRIAARFAGV